MVAVYRYFSVGVSEQHLLSVGCSCRCGLSDLYYCLLSRTERLLAVPSHHNSAASHPIVGNQCIVPLLKYVLFFDLPLKSIVTM